MVAKPRFHWKLIALFCVGLILAGCVAGPTLRERLEEIPPKHLSFYNFDPTVPLISRVTDAPEELLALYAGEEEGQLARYQPTVAEREQIGLVFDRLPLRHRTVLQERLIGVYCVEEFSGSAMADYVVGPNDELYSVLILHPRVFSMDASELLTYRENTAFQHDDPDIEITISLSNAVSALAYIVLHESTHIVDYVERHTPYVEPGMFELFGVSSRDTSFTDEVWRGYRTVGADVEFSYQKDLRFYGLGGEPRLSNNEVDALYENLARSPFASLYGALSWAEDFAEFVTFYYLVYGLGAHYAVRIQRAGKLVFEYEPMASSTVLDREGYLDPELLTPAPAD